MTTARGAIRQYSAYFDNIIKWHYPCFVHTSERFKNLTATVSASSPIRYPGGKFRARKILAEHLPTIEQESRDGHIEEVLEVKHVVAPFFGGGSFELFMTQMGIKVSGFDGFDLLANTWEHILSFPDAVADALQKYHGAVDSAVFKNLQQRLKNDPVMDLQSAAEFLVVNRCSFSGATLSGGFSAASADTRFTQSMIDKVRAFDNPLLSVEYGLFEEPLGNIEKVSKTAGVEVDLLFLDPPYWLERAKNKLYGIGGDLHQHFDHEGLRNLVAASGKRFLLTYNDAPEVRELWADYDIQTAEWSYGMNKSKKSSEIIIKNY